MGSALAAISSAFLLSTLGVAGTVIGAALASVVATVGSAVYVHLFRRTGEQLRDVRATLTPPPRGGPATEPTAIPDRPTGVADPGRASDETMLLPVGEYTRPPGDAGTESGAAPTGERRVWLARSLVGAVVVFVVAMGVVTLAETAIGRSFASLFGHGDDGSTISRIVDDKRTRDDTPKSPGGATPGPTGSTGSTSSHAPDTGDKGTSPPNGGGGGATSVPSTTPTTRPSGSPSSNPTGSTPPTTPVSPTKPPAGGSAGGDPDAGGGAAAGNEAGGRGGTNANAGSGAGTR
ncbi:hypothetical protein [Embleya scabrispora]|uniref:hypothetical protein n=1 Tax=Embleya scabrispora TaxID=159449 RepID=UPI00117F539C|nr:hypothetical protein [Embleya scabrispora]